MCIEVRELVIKATILQDDPGSPSGRSATSSHNVSPNEQLINMCVEKVLEILKDRNER